MRHRRESSLVFFVLLVATSVLLCGCGGDGGGNGHDGNQTGTISGSVSGTTIIAVDSDGDIVAEDDTTGKASDANGNYPFTLTSIPVGVNVKVYLIHGGFYPVYFDSTGDDLPDTNVFSLGSAVTVNLGFVRTQWGEKGATAIPEKSPTQTEGVSAGTEDRSIPPSVNQPDTTGLSLNKVLSKGFDALEDGWVLRAKGHFEAAESLAGTATSNEADTARFFYALTRIAALGFDTYSDQDPSDMSRLGDILDRVGCDPADTIRANLDPIFCPAPMPNDSPTGREIQDALYNVVRPELEAAITNLEGVSESFNTTWTEPFDGTRVESDYGDVLFFNAAVKAALTSILIQYANDLDADLDATANSADMTIEEFLDDNPSLLTPAVGYADLLNIAEGYTREALDELDAAIIWMDQTETDPQANDFINLADVTPEEIADAHEYLAAAKLCLDGPCTVDDNGTPFETSDDVVLDLSRVFEGVDLSAQLPPFTDDVPGYFPDPTLGGIIVQGVDINEDVDPEDGIPDVLE